MNVDELLDRFYARRASSELPFVIEDTVEVVDGVYRGRRGEIVVLAYATSPMQFLVEFGDGTDEYFPASSLRLVDRDSRSD